LNVPAARLGDNVLLARLLNAAKSLPSVA